MIIKSKHLKLEELERLEDKLPKMNIHWDKGAVGKVDGNSPTSWSDGVMTIPGQGKGQVSSLVYLDIDETVIWDKSPENQHYDEADES